MNNFTKMNRVIRIRLDVGKCILKQSYARFSTCLVSRSAGVYVPKYRNIKDPNAFKEIKWVEPEEVKPWDVRRTGDLECMPEIDGNKPCIIFEDLPEYNNLDDTLKKLVSLKFNGRQEILKAYKKELLQRVQRYNGDETSLESRIALYTARIRNQHVHHAFVPTDKTARYLTKLLVDRRRRLLNTLRSEDYKRYEWVLERLNLVHKFSPEVVSLEREDCLRKLVHMYVDRVKQQKMKDLEQKFKSEQSLFIYEKDKLVSKMDDTSEEITKLQNEIHNLEKKLTTETYDL